MSNPSTMSECHIGTETKERSSQGRSELHKAAEVAAEAKEQIKSQAAAAKDEAVERGRSFVAQQKERTASELGALGNAARDIAEKLRREGHESVAEYTEMIAGGIDRTAGYLRNSQFDRLYRDASDFARRRPQVVLGGLFVAGLALSRFLKASQSEVEPEDAPSPGDPNWSSAGQRNVSGQGIMSADDSGQRRNIGLGSDLAGSSSIHTPAQSWAPGMPSDDPLTSPVAPNPPAASPLLDTTSKPFEQDRPESLSDARTSAGCDNPFKTRTE